jgi:hypothetical protein
MPNGMLAQLKAVPVLASGVIGFSCLRYAYEYDYCSAFLTYATGLRTVFAFSGQSKPGRSVLKI